MYEYLINKLPQHALSNVEIDNMCSSNVEGYVGTFPADKCPKLTKGQCCILNTETIATSKLPNSVGHWVSIIRVGNETYIYDSFGRESEDLSPYFLEEWIETDKKAEQKINNPDGTATTDCGARSISWLYCVSIFGVMEVADVI